MMYVKCHNTETMTISWNNTESEHEAAIYFKSPCHLSVYMTG